MNAFSHLNRLAPPLLILSLISNLAVLISPIFMMQVLDRVIPSGNLSTLALLIALAVAALLLQMLVETSRDVSLGRTAHWVERQGTAFALQPGRAQPQTLIERVAGLSQFLSGHLAPVALNLPWMPLLLGALYLLHPLFVIVFAALLLLSWGARAAVRALTQPLEQTAQRLSQQQEDALDSAARAQHTGAPRIVATNLFGRFADSQGQRLNALDKRQLTQSLGGGVSNLLRALAQILALAVGAFLVTQDALSAGGMIAASILLAKTYSTADMAMAQWPAIREAAQNLRGLRAEPNVSHTPQTDVPNLSGGLRAETLVVPRAGGAPPRLDRISLTLDPGQCLVIVGNSGSGKTTLIEALAGLRPAPIGSVFLDQTEVKTLSDQAMFQHVGYLPQVAQLMPGSIAQNVGGFSDPLDAEKIVEAAKIAGVHGLISALPNAYDTDLTTEHLLLSTGQTQRIALARAIYNQPAYLFLDEPNALLDAEGEKALLRALARLKEQGTTIVMILHRSGLMGLADKVLRLDHGRCADFGPRSEVLGRMAMGRRQTELPLLSTSLQDLADWIGSQFTRSGDAEFAQKAQLVAEELFNVVRLNGPDNRARTANFTFTFKDDTNCELLIVETGPPSKAPGKLNKVLAKVKAAPGAAEYVLPQDERAIATVASLTEALEIRAVDNSVLFRAAIADKMAKPETPSPRLA